jgi:phage baseplate assembly protein W
MPQIRDTREYLGIGWRFPLQVTPSGAIAKARYEHRVEESVYLILATAKGERAMLPDFGCGIHELVFAPNTPNTIGLVAQQVRRALVDWEPRIDVLDIVVDSPEGEPNLLLIKVGYRIRANNALANLVYPFYLREGGL